LNRLSGRKVGGLYGARKAEIGGTFQKERESEINRGFRKQRKDRGASRRVLGCLIVRATRNSIFMRAAGPIPAVAVASVLHSAAVGGFVAGVVGLL